MPKAYVHLVRHAQGFHNLCVENHQLPDPDLTPLGLEQCSALRSSFPHHDKITHLVASPMRRTIYTCLHSFAPAVERGIKVVALPDIQEVSPFPCDVGSDPEKLQREFGDAGQVDLGLVREGWNDKGIGSEYAPEMRKLEVRAARARKFFRDLAKKGDRNRNGNGSTNHHDNDGGEEEATNVVAVTHGGFLHFLTEDWDGLELGKGTGWHNCEWRTYEVLEEGDRGEVRLKEVEDSWRRRRGSLEGLSETEQMELKSAYGKDLDEGFASLKDDDEETKE
ncbi:histidine phosphatase superfamily [Cladorrhinum samala]|uniref:Histidine phosphatase superfamily n=1 Tax=Cladorrhinum samala TaxID=585594 RepID=A0AAV9HNJ1_9PEZI|nr:histidine phosphatase superfamily [Cladorrhinum samala]